MQVRGLPEIVIFICPTLMQKSIELKLCVPTHCLYEELANYIKNITNPHTPLVLAKCKYSMLGVPCLNQSSLSAINVISWLNFFLFLRLFILMQKLIWSDELGYTYIPPLKRMRLNLLLTNMLLSCTLLIYFQHWHESF